MSNPVLRPNPRLTRRLYTGRRQLLFYFAGTNNLYLVDDPRSGWARVATTPPGGTRITVANGFVTCGPSMGYGSAMWRCRVGFWGQATAYTVSGGTAMGVSNGNWTVLNGGTSSATFLRSSDGVNYQTVSTVFPPDMDRVQDFACLADGTIVAKFYDNAGLFPSSRGVFRLRQGTSPVLLFTETSGADFARFNVDADGNVFYAFAGGGLYYLVTASAVTSVASINSVSAGAFDGSPAWLGQIQTTTALAVGVFQNRNAPTKSYDNASADFVNSGATAAEGTQAAFNGVEFVAYDSATHALHFINESALGVRVPLPGSAETGVCACVSIPD